MHRGRPAASCRPCQLNGLHAHACMGPANILVVTMPCTDVPGAADLNVVRTGKEHILISPSVNALMQDKNFNS